MKVVAVQKDDEGTIINYKLEDGNIVGHSQAVNLAENGQLDDYNVATARNGLKSLRSNPDGDKSNNLDNLPSF